jgi:hypothetical protein
MYSTVIWLAAFVMAADAAPEWERLIQDVQHSQSVPAIGSRIAKLRKIDDARGQALWERVEPVIGNDAVNVIARGDLLALAWEKSDETSRPKVLDTILRWSAELESKPFDKDAGDLRQRADALSEFLHNVDFRGLDLDPQLLVLLRTASWSPWFGGASRVAVRLLATGAFPAEAKASCACEIVCNLGNHTGIFSDVLRLLDPSCFPRLRALVRSGNSPEDFHYGAAAALAHFGDQETLAIIQEKLAKFEPRGQARATYLEGYMWKIRVQKSPDTLVEYIAGSEGVNEFDVIPRMWAIERAVDANVPPERIKQAIIKYVEAAKAQNKQYGLSHIKLRAMRLGLLKDEDLPGIVVPATSPSQEPASKPAETRPGAHSWKRSTLTTTAPSQAAP